MCCLASSIIFFKISPAALCLGRMLWLPKGCSSSAICMGEKTALLSQQFVAYIRSAF